jgi:glutamyl-tRNA reductase
MHGHELQQEELQLALARLAKGENAEQIMREFAHRLTQKLLHPTSIVLREAAKAEDPAYLEHLQHSLTEVVQHRRKAKK